MLYLKSWLEDYIDLSGLKNQELASLISLKSGEVEEVYEVCDYFNSKVVVGKIISLEKHPNADKLTVMQIDIGKEETVQILTTATNIYEAMLLPVALVGAKLPMFTIVQREMRGLVSSGMGIGKSELLLELSSDGLWDLKDEYAKFSREPNLGQSICLEFPEFFPVETILDIKYLQDKFGVYGSHLGLSLELARILDDSSRLKGLAKKLQNPDLFWQEFEPLLQNLSIDENYKLNFEDSMGYTKIFSLLTLNQANQYLKTRVFRRLFLLKYNILGNFADTSNYLLYDVGVPSHFAIKPKKQELNWEIKALENSKPFEGLGKLEKTTLPKKSVVLLDKTDAKIVHLPGISGSKFSQVTKENDDLIIEVANFSAEEVAKNIAIIGYRSDGARFWASTVNPLSVLVWWYQFFYLTNFSVKLVGIWINPTIFGENSGLSFHQKIQLLWKKSTSRKILLNKKYLLSRWGETNLSDLSSSIEKKLPLLGKVDGDYFYPDNLYQKIETLDDLFFELTKLIGFESLTNQKLTQSTQTFPKSSFEKINIVKGWLTKFGFTESINRPFIGEIQNKSFGEAKNLKLLNSFSQDFQYLRSDLVQSLLKNLILNQNLGQEDLQIFEISKVYSQINSDLKEKLLLGAIALDSDPYLLTSIISLLESRFDLTKLTTQPLEDRLGSGYVYFENNQKIATLQQIRSKVKKDFQLTTQKPVWYLEIDLTSIIDRNLICQGKYFDQSDFPSLRRNISLEVDSKFSWLQLVEIVESLKNHNFKVYLQPLERLDTLLENGRSVINFSLELVSFESSLESFLIEDLLNQILLEIQKIHPLARFR